MKNYRNDLFADPRFNELHDDYNPCGIVFQPDNSKNADTYENLIVVSADNIVNAINFFAEYHYKPARVFENDPSEFEEEEE
jgi:hypothetical protein